MTYKELKLKIKEEQKELTKNIKKWKSYRKPDNRPDGMSQWDIQSRLYWMKSNFRYKHIAYCEFFNHTPYERIEQPRDWKKPSRSVIDELKSNWTEQLDWDGQISEALRNCA